MKNNAKQHIVKFYVSTSSNIIESLPNRKRSIKKQFDKMGNLEKHSDTSVSFKMFGSDMSPQFLDKIQSVLHQQLPGKPGSMVANMLLNNNLPSEKTVKYISNVGMVGCNMLSDEDLARLFGNNQVTA